MPDMMATLLSGTCAELVTYCSVYMETELEIVKCMTAVSTTVISKIHHHYNYSLSTSLNRQYTHHIP